MVGQEELAKQAYVPFIVNKALGLYIDTVLFANEMNMRAHLDSDMQYAYLLNSIRKSYRNQKWVKAEGSEDVEAIKQYYGINHTKAKQALRVLSADQLAIVRKRLDTGGS